MDKRAEQAPQTQGQESTSRKAVAAAAGVIFAAGSVGVLMARAGADGNPNQVTPTTGHTCNTIWRPECAPGSTDDIKVPTTPTTEAPTTTTTRRPSTTTTAVVTTTTTTPGVTTTTTPETTIPPETTTTVKPPTPTTEVTIPPEETASAPIGNEGATFDVNFSNLNAAVFSQVTQLG